MAQEKGQNKGQEGVGITNRGLDQEQPGQDFVMGEVEELEAQGSRDDLNTGSRLTADDNRQIGRNLEADTDTDEGDGLTSDEQSGGERHIDSQVTRGSNSHH